jgi:hypothetical protein
LVEYHDWVGNQKRGETDEAFELRLKQRSARRASNRRRTVVSKHERHKGFTRRANGRIYCAQCNSEKMRATRAYHREYARRARRRAGIPSRENGSTEWQAFQAYISQDGIPSSLTIDELSAEIDVNPETIRGWVKSGWLDTEKIKNDTGKGQWRQRTIVVLI